MMYCYVFCQLNDNGDISAMGCSCIIKIIIDN